MAIEVYSREARQLIDQAVRRVLANPNAAFNRNSVAGGGACFLAKTDGSGITARSGTTAGSGTVTLQTVSANGAISAQQDQEGNDVTVTAYNVSTEALPSSSYTFVVQETISGTLWAVFEDCPT